MTIEEVMPIEQCYTDTGSNKFIFKRNMTVSFSYNTNSISTKLV